MRLCKKCNLEHEDSKFERVKSKYYRNTCNSCRYAAKSPDARKKINENSKARDRFRRTNNIPLAILYDCRKSDKKHGRENDLTVDFIKDKISKGCEYCGELSLRMTLDRINNKEGHVQSNLKAACIRCNYLRRDMPYNAWIKLSDALNQIRIEGLFKNWTCRAR